MDSLLENDEERGPNPGVNLFIHCGSKYFNPGSSIYPFNSLSARYSKMRRNSIVYAIIVLSSVFIFMDREDEAHMNLACHSRHSTSKKGSKAVTSRYIYSQRLSQSHVNKN